MVGHETYGSPPRSFERTFSAIDKLLARWKKTVLRTYHLDTAEQCGHLWEHLWASSSSQGCLVLLGCHGFFGLQGVGSAQLS